MLPAKIILSLYGLLLLSGAYFGFKAGSKVSLIMGITTGILVFIGLYVSNTNFTLGFRFLAGISGFLAVTFLIRLIKTGKFMPAGMLLTVSVIACIVAIIQLLKK